MRFLYFLSSRRYLVNKLCNFSCYRVTLATMSPGNQQVKDVFSGRSIFVTGASGFLGKVLVEKLLYSVPEIKNVYLLIRPLKGHSPSDRLNKLLEVRIPYFDRIQLESIV